MVDGKPEVFLVTKGQKDAVARDADALRDKRLFTFTAGDIDGLRCSAKGGFSLERSKEGAWTVRTPRAANRPTWPG